MKKFNYVSVVLLILVVLLAVACEKRRTTEPDPGFSPPDEEINPLDLTPRENAEAEEAALWLSNEIVAPQDLYEKVLKGFNLLRGKYADSIPEVNIPFKFPTGTNGILMGIDSLAAGLIRSGIYDAWDSLNAYYRSFQIDTSDWSYGNSFIFYVTISFEGRLNTYRLCDLYEKLPGVIWASAGGYVGDWPCTYPWIDSTVNLTFLVRNAWGDCPAGCIMSHYYYFKMKSGDIDYIGDWEFSYPLSPPEWWDEAKVAFETYRFYPSDPI